MGRRDRPVLDELCKRLALRVVELGRLARCLAVNQSSRSFGIEPQHPIPDHLKPDTADPRRIRARAAVSRVASMRDGMSSNRLMVGCEHSSWPLSGARPTASLNSGSKRKLSQSSGVRGLAWQ